MKRFLFRSAIVVFLFVLLASVFAWYALRPLAVRGDVVDFTIPAGASPRQSARLVQAAGIGVAPEFLYWLARLSGRASLIKAGSYEVSPGTSAWHLLRKLTDGDVSQGELSVIEGWSFRQLRSALDAAPDLRHDSAGLADAEIAKALGIGSEQLEGLFLPDKYFFDKHSSDLALLARAYRAGQASLAQVWAGRAANLPLQDPYQLLTLASLIEKETGRREDRTLIAAVFINRLRQGMRLQTDPTVIYGLGTDFDGNLRRRDLERDGAYNTYTRTGLPPTPIALAGMQSLEAAAHPAASNALYFVARGDGSSQFSATLEEHNRAVDKYQRRSK